MTVTEWLSKGTRYKFESGTFEKIARDRGCDPSDDVYDTTKVSERQKDLMSADLIFTAVVLSPSSTASLSQSHNGYQKVIGSEHETNIGSKIKYALLIYRKYNDPKAELLADVKPKIKFLAIKDVDSL